MRWTHNGRKIRPSNHYHLENKKQTLIIKNFTTNDEGTYRAVRVHSNITGGCSFDMTNLQKPTTPSPGSADHDEKKVTENTTMEIGIIKNTTPFSSSTTAKIEIADNITPSSGSTTANIQVNENIYLITPSNSSTPAKIEIIENNTEPSENTTNIEIASSIYKWILIGKKKKKNNNKLR